MDLIDMQASDFMFMFGVTLTNLKKFKIILDNMQFNYDGKNPDHLKAKEYLETVLYPTIQESIKAAEGKDGS